MINDWEKAIEFVLKEEGGYTNDVNDKGGETNFGISKRRYPNEDIRGMTRERAMELYRKDFWDTHHCDEIPTPLAIAYFDGLVNQGEGGATKCLQIALGGLDIDGGMGEKTLAAAVKSGETTLRRFMAQRMVRYIRAIVKDNTQDAFADNWSNRLMRCAQLVFGQRGTA